MQFGKTGKVVEDFYVAGLRWSPVYLFAGPHSVLFEAGFACAAKLYEADIRSVLGARNPEMLFLTHVHYDHCGATSYLKGIYPGIKVAASRHSAEILARPNARKLMMSLSQNAISLVAQADEVDRESLIHEPFTPFEVDIELDGDHIVTLGDVTVQVIFTPGHTRDQLSYYIPEKRILIGTEATGCMDRAGTFIPEFLVDFDLYMASLKRLAALPIDVLCQGHHFVYVGQDEVRTFFDRSIEAAENFRERVIQLLNEHGGRVDQVVQQIKNEQYDRNPNVKQPEPAYLLNLRARVAHLAAKLDN
jgi:2-aminobenzoylacetyl-CoA thioesterase